MPLRDVFRRAHGYGQLRKIGDLPALAAELGRALGIVMARAAAVTPRTISAQQRDESSALLTVEQAAKRLSVPRSWLYRKAKSLPFSRKLGHRTLRFDAAGLERWAANRVRG